MRNPPDITPNVRELLTCPRCGRKTLVYAPAGFHERYLDYECLSPTCHYTLRKYRGSTLFVQMLIRMLDGVYILIALLSLGLLFSCL